MEKIYRVEDSVHKEIEYLSESEMICGAEVWAERMNEEREEGDSEYIVSDVESAIDVYESASIWVKEVKYEGVSMFGTVNEFDTLYDIADDIESRLISLMEITFEDEIISECEMSLETLQDYVREIDSVNEQESLNNFNNFSDLIHYEYGRKEVA